MAAVINLRLRAGVDAEFAYWHARMSTAAAGLPGFISTEVNAAAPAACLEWNIVQHFRSADNLHGWLESGPHRRLLKDAESLVDNSDGAALREEEIAEGCAGGSVIEVVKTHVKPGKAREYQEWAEKIHRVEAQFPGYRGVLLQPPASQRQDYWTTLVRFATPEQLDAWLNSDSRRELLREHEALVESWEHHRLPSSFAGWFPTDTASGESPAAWKQSMLVVLVLFPIVMLKMFFLNPLLAGLNSSFAMFIGNVISVALIAWPFMPLVIRPMHWWLLPRKDSAGWVNPVGIALLLVFYTLEITAFARFL